ncbi:hypothetical protein CkaCkLH20_09371 [Colletotrichum karsti]|uniref:Lysine-specific metallo-endopeptidase domain-containing protein n=1 Tax=Colletotrichum karsti TaxID=1095194 RepID=A0A9P6LH60_9PEZI|nr:uncharacterized protein CkaCkLH20_09371 [Colletotrichum karsti]KAF9873208.1 hypothetical protein CkaCkLH20_09371 [Colletotrichum karsti]
MAKGSAFLRLFSGLLFFLSGILALELGDIFTLQDRSNDGGCNDRLAVLDDWHTESIYSTDAAVTAIDNYDREVEVRRSLSVFFGIANRARTGVNTPSYQARMRVRENIIRVRDFLNDNPDYNRDDYLFFCDSTFFTLHERTDPALDFQGNEIRDQNGDPVPIDSVPEYRTALNEDPDNKAWWSGDLLENMKGYFFTEYGANYCYDDDLGVTADIQPYIQGANGQAVTGDSKTSLIMCPHSFDRTDMPNTYRDANNLITDSPPTNLADAIPKSATFLHEMFHTLYGGYFLAGDDETYDIAACQNLARSNPNEAEINPENYVFFIAHMYHLFGVPDANEAWSIPHQWTFRHQGVGQNRVFGAA